MLKERLKNYNLILASASPRRQQFFKDLDLDFEIQLKPVIEEYPKSLRHFEISDYLAQLKSLPFKETLQDQDILVTSDTIVWHNEHAIGKPRDKAEAFQIIKNLSGATHEVITSVCFTTKTTQKTVSAITKVTFKGLQDLEIQYYLDHFKPYDKAGAYGIQDWIGYVAITKIEGSYYNVMGLPVHLVYETLMEITN